MRRERRGAGITERTVSVANVRNAGQMRAMKGELVAWNEAREDGLFRAVSADAYAVCNAILEGVDVLSIEEDTPEDFAQRIVRTIEIANAAIEKGRADSAARFAFEAARLWATASMKWAWEEHALYGRATKEKMNAAHDARRGPKEATLEVLGVMQCLIDDGRKVSEAARLTFERHGAGKNAGSNRKLWYTYKK